MSEMNDINEMTFEAAFAELEAIIAQMEGGEVALAESVVLYERGRALSAHCERLLSEAELRVNTLDEAENEG